MPAAARDPPTGRQGTPWCVHCGIWLIHDQVTGAWISFAEHAHANPSTNAGRRSRRPATPPSPPQPTVESLLPAGWHSRIGEPSRGGCYTLDLHPPTGPVDLYANLVPPIGDYAWRVRVYHRGIRVCRTVFVQAIATPATFPEAADTIPQAVAPVDVASTAARIGPHGGTS